jgi:HTH-type transcriptional regulator/antitoxin HigA
VQALFAAKLGTKEADELEVLGLLIEKFEQAKYPVSVAGALEALRFRMQQEQLSPRDLEPYIGSRARVSEVLSGSRPLSIDMMRALHRHLGIPAESLLRPSEANQPLEDTLPSKPAMAKLSATGLMRASEDFRDFIERAFGKNLAPALLRKTRTERTNAKTDPAALQAWCAAVLLKSTEIKVAKITSDDLNIAQARQLAKLSCERNPLKKVRKALSDMGVALVFLEHLPGTYLDGAAMYRGDGVKVIALTLRYDRVDNFWFTLLHEFAHVALHLNEETRIVLDDLEIRSSELVEDEADRFAQEALIPDDLWKMRASANFSVSDVQDLAREIGIHPAIVAGRWQRQFRDYRQFSKLLGHGDVRSQALALRR